MPTPEPDPARLTVGATVREAREAAGLSVEEVAARTRVRASVITSLENDDFRPSGGDVYARGHLKAIATAVGLSATQVAAQFDRQQGAEQVSPGAGVEPIVQPTRVGQASSSESLGLLAGTLGSSVAGQRRGTNWTAVMAIAVAVVVLAGLTSMLVRRGSSPAPVAGSSPGTTASQSPTPRASTPSPGTSSPSSPAEPSVSTAPSDVVAAADGVVVRLTVTGRASWVRATNGAGGRTLYEGTLSQGDTKTFRDKQKVALLIGNAGAVSLKVNGTDLGAPGSQGQVLKVSFLPGDPTAQAG